MEIGKKIDVVLKDPRQIENLLRREPGVDAAFIETSLDGAAHNAGIADKRNLFPLGQPPSFRRRLNTYQVVLDHHLQSVDALVTGIQHDMNIVARLNFSQIH